MSTARDIGPFQFGAQLIGYKRDHHGRHECTSSELKRIDYSAGAEIIIAITDVAVMLADEFDDDEFLFLVYRDEDQATARVFHEWSEEMRDMVREAKDILEKRQAEQQAEAERVEVERRRRLAEAQEKAERTHYLTLKAKFEP